MAQELLALDKWVVDRLTSDSDLAAIVGARVFEGFAPESDPADPDGDPPAYPLIVFSVQHATDTKGTGGATLLTSVLLRAEVIGEGGGFGDIQPADKLMQSLLDSPDVETVTIDGDSYDILGCTRMQPIQRSGAFAGIRYNHLGGMWRLDVQAA